MLNKVINITTIILSIICCGFMIFTSVSAASQQATRISTCVQFTPGLLVKVEAIIDDGEPEPIFDNYTNSGLNHTHFSVTPSLPNEAMSSPNVIKFKVTNYTLNKDIVVSVEFVSSTPQGCYLDILDNKTVINTNQIDRNNSSTPKSETTNGFRAISLFQNATLDLIIRIQSVESET